MKSLPAVLPYPAAVADVDIHPRASRWDGAPAMGAPESAATTFALLAAGATLWLSYPGEEAGRFVVIAFDGHVEHQLSNLDDATLKNHPYASAGLATSSFNELSESLQTVYWRPLGARHWVVSLWDCTLDVVARAVRVAHDSKSAATPLEALLEALAVA